MRADIFFVEKYGSRSQAKAALERGEILRMGKSLSPSDEIREGDVFTFLAGQQPFVSRGGYKLARGLCVFGESVCGRIFADLGASTGGFCDVLLRNGVKRVYAVDIGEAQLDGAVASDARVVVMDKTNARYLTADSFPEPIDGVVSDLSFISLRLILPAVHALLAPQGCAIVLLKPQFECGGIGLNKRGILPVRLHRPILSGFYDFCITTGLAPQNIVNAPVREKKNIEYVVLLKKDASPMPQWDFLRRAQIFFEEDPENLAKELAYMQNLPYNNCNEHRNIF